MPRGPLGFERLTNVGPFTSERVTIEEEFSEQDARVLPTMMERFIFEQGMEEPEVRRFSREVTLKQEPEETGLDILDGIAKEISELGEGFALLEYIVAPGEWGYIIRTSVDERVQRRGVATDMRQDAFQHMRELGADVVYSYPASSAGKALLDSSGFGDTGVSIGRRNMWKRDL